MSKHMKKCGKVLLLALVIWSLFHTNIRVQRTLLGYDIGHLKSEEAKLLRERALLTMKLAKLTSRNSLTQILQQKKVEKNVKRKHKRGKPDGTNQKKKAKKP